MHALLVQWDAGVCSRGAPGRGALSQCTWQCSVVCALKQTKWPQAIARQAWQAAAPEGICTGERVGLEDVVWRQERPRTS
jgi:hypothetical protein